MNGSLIIRDTVNLLNNFPIIGEEKIVISYRVDGIKNSNTSVELFVYDVSPPEIGSQFRNLDYELQLTSKAHFLNSKIKIKHAWQKPISDIVKDIAKTHLSIKEMDVDEAGAPQDIIIGDRSPFDAIDFLKRRAVDGAKKASIFMFYQDRTGYKFKSLAKLFKSALDSGERHTYTLTNQTVNPDPDIRSILSVGLGGRNSIQRNKEGYTGVVVDKFDVLAKEMTTHVFDLSKDSKKIRVPADRESLQSSSFLSDYSASSFKSYFTPHDSTKKDTLFADDLAARTSFLESFSSGSVSISVQGDPTISLGDAISLDIPKITGFTDAVSMDDWFSGVYMITGLSHNLAIENYTMTVTLSKLEGDLDIDERLSYV